jgi:hypothetical protein
MATAEDVRYSFQVRRWVLHEPGQRSAGFAGNLLFLLENKETVKEKVNNTSDPFASAHCIL